MRFPANIKVHIAITVTFALLSVAGLLFSYLTLTGSNNLFSALLGEQGLIQLTVLSFICFIVYAVVTFNILAYYMTEKKSVELRESNSEAEKERQTSEQG